MVNIIRFLFCALACFFSITVYASNDPVRDNWDKHLKNQDAYHQRTQRAAAEVIADIKMGAPNSAERTSVKQLLVRSGVAIDGSKVKIGASVTKQVDTAKVASTLVDRLKNAKDYAKKVGKASIPAFVGTAAIHALMEGIDWVMDEGGKVTKKPVNPNPKTENTEGKYTSDYQYYTQENDGTYTYAYTAENACKIHFSYHNAWQNVFTYRFDRMASSSKCEYTLKWNNNSGSDTKGTETPSRKANPHKGTTEPERVEVTPKEIEDAIKKALESNNPALATAIAEAMKSAYTQDNSEGQPKTTNPLVADAQNDMQRAVDGALDTPTSTGGTAERPSGYYKITDGDKTIEGYVTPSDTTGQTNTDTESNTVTDPITGNQTTTGTSTGSIQFPAFCDWAGIVCDWIGWTKQEPEEPKDDQPVLTEVQIPYAPFSIASFNAQCPVDMNLSLDLMGQNQNFVLPMSPFCDFFSSIKPFVIALASFFAVRLLGNASFNSGN